MSSKPVCLAARRFHSDVGLIILLEASATGVRRVGIKDISNASRLADVPSQCLGHVKGARCPAEDILDSALLWLTKYFSSPTTAGDLPSLDLPRGDSFSAQVWRELAANTRPGQTVSYGQLATRVGKPTAARAVGQAMRTNPVPILVPCHRVVRSDGSLGNYSGGSGTPTKEWLLQHEAKSACH